jgi:uncharacterized protein
MRRRAVIPILVFIAASTLAAPVLGALQDVSGLSPDILRLTVFSTTIGAVVVWLIWRSALAYPPAEAAGSVRQALLAACAVLLAGALAYGIAWVEGARWHSPGAGAFGASVTVFLLVQLLGAAAEEVGWRGLVQPLLETRLSAWKAALITGVLFGVGHFYLAFAVGPLAFALFIVSAIAMSLILATATVGRAWPSRIMLATLLHFLVNLETFFLFTDGDGSVSYFADLALAFGVFGAVALWVLARRGPVSRAF